VFVSHASILVRIVLSHNVFHAENLLYFLKINAFLIALMENILKIYYVIRVKKIVKIVIKILVFIVWLIFSYIKMNAYQSVQKRLLLKILDVKNALNFVFIALKNNVLSVIHSISY
jgi:hypothetical protein